jgi:hypothetical protein
VTTKFIRTAYVGGEHAGEYAWQEKSGLWRTAPAAVEKHSRCFNTEDAAMQPLPGEVSLVEILKVTEEKIA